MKVVVAGAGMGGLSVALGLAQRGHTVTIVEPREVPGGLAAGFSAGGFDYDGGPYILLDRPGLAWAFGKLGLSLDALALARVPHLYSVTFDDGKRVDFFASLDETAETMGRAFGPEAGTRYRAFVGRMHAIHDRARPLLLQSHPTPLDLLRSGSWRDAAFLLRPLGAALSASGLPPAVIDAIAIWTHVAGQTLGEAPAPMAFVPALIHHDGAWVPAQGIRAVPQAVAAAARAAGVAFVAGRVARIRVERGTARGLKLASGEDLDADVVVSGAHGIGTYLELVDPEALPSRARTSLRSLPLQGPGVAAYLAIRRRETPKPPYLKFLLPSKQGERCRALVEPGVMDPSIARDGEWPARLVVPLDHPVAERLDEPAQRERLESYLAEKWWREGVESVRVVETRVPRTWGSSFLLHRDSMNPVMTQSFMRHGRIAHRSPWVKRLWLVGSSTHPGQWVRFCAISGVLAAERIHAES